MAKLRHGIFGPISGKIGPIVGATWKNIAYVRALPKKRTKQFPKSAAQHANEQKFKFVTELLVPFHSYVTIGFQNRAKSRTEINAAFSENYKAAILGVYPELSVDYAKLVLSKGNLPPLQGVTATLISADTLELIWQQNTNQHASFDDQLMLVLYSPALKIADGFIGGAGRALEKCKFKFDPQLIGAELEVYVSVTSLTRKIVSNSEYLGKIVP